MADNTVLNAGSGGDTIATDDVSGIKYQRVKLVNGTLDATDAIPGDASNGLDVDVTRLPALPAGTNAIGKLAANSGVDIGDVDVTSISGQAADGGTLPAVQSIIGGYDGTNTQAIVTDANGRLVIVDGGGSITVDGTVTANAGTGPWPITDNGGSLTVDGSVAITGTVAVTDNSGTLTVDAPVATPVFVRLSDGTSAIATLPVSLASLPALAAGTNNIGFITATPGTTGGWSKTTALAQTTTKKAVKASAGTFGGYYAYNPNASVAYIQVFDLASGSVTLGTTAPDLVFAIPATSGANLEIVNGVNMATAITLACTTTAAGSTAPGTGLDLTLFYK